MHDIRPNRLPLPEQHFNKAEHTELGRITATLSQGKFTELLDKLEPAEEVWRCGLGRRGNCRFTPFNKFRITQNCNYEEGVPTKTVGISLKSSFHPSKGDTTNPNAYLYTPKIECY